MTMTQYLKDKFFSIFILFITSILSFTFMYLIDINIYSIIFIEMMFIFSLVLITFLDFIKKKNTMMIF